MSRLYFHTREATAKIMGTEAHWLRSIAYKAGCAPVDDMDEHLARRLHSLLSPNHWLTSWPTTQPGWFPQFKQSYQTALKAGSEDLIDFEGKPIDPFHLVLNTAIAIGSPTVQLAARIHAQCEIHGWIDGPHRAWLADLIDQGLNTHILRRTITRKDMYGSGDEVIPQGWEGVTALLRTTSKGPIVLSYSVTDGFPNHRIAGYSDEDERWEVLGDDGQWEVAFASLAVSGGGLQITPDNLSVGWFGHGLSLLDLAADDWQDRLQTATSGGTK